MKKNVYDQILSKVSENFYSAPVKLGRRFMMRQFISGNINLGFNRPENKELVMNNSNVKGRNYPTLSTPIQPLSSVDHTARRCVCYRAT